MSIDADIAMDDLDFIRRIKGDFNHLVVHIERLIASGTLSEVDRSLFGARAVEMELALNQILLPDWNRASVAARVDEALPSSDRYRAMMEQPMLRVPTNPATCGAA